MNYLGRQIFPFTPNWADAVERTLTFDLRETALGFGAEYFTPLATYTVNGWSFGLLHQSGADVLSFESFCDSLVGRLNGFWLPCPLLAARFNAGIDTSNFKIVTEGLAETWNTRPDQHLLFTFMDGTQAAGQIQGVVDNGDGTETVTLTAALPQAPTGGTSIQRLHYVRMAADDENYDSLAEAGVSTIKLNVVELSLEYTNAETGLQPIYLYHFQMNAPVGMDWYYTSFAAPVVSNGKVYNPWPINHGAIKQTTDGNCNPVDITAKPDVAHPFALLLGMPPGKVLWCQISRAWLATPDVVKNLFTGFVKNVDDNGTEYVAHAFDRLDWLRSKVPQHYVGTVCNYDLYDPATCTVGRAPFETTVTIVNVLAGELPVLQCSFNFGFQLANWQSEDWFQGGLLEASMGVNYDLRSVVHSHWNAAVGLLELTLSAPLRSFNAAAGVQLQVTAGCDHTSAGPNGCGPKFGNFVNFGACVDVPDRNLTLQGLNTSVSQGGKKA